MPLTMELFFTPNWITWNGTADEPDYVGANPVPKYSVELAADPYSLGDQVTIGRSKAALFGTHPQGHYFELPFEEDLSEKTATVRWDPLKGLLIAAVSKNPLWLRGWGTMQETPLAGGNARERANDRYWNEVVVGNELRLVGRLPGEGAWFRITPSADFDAEWHRSPEEGATNEGSITIGRRHSVKTLFFCSRFPESAEHVLWGSQDECGEAGHNDRSSSLAFVLGHYAPYFVWPPRGWLLPIEKDVDSIKRVQTVQGKRINTTKWRDLVLQRLVEAGVPFVTEDDLPDRLVRGGVLTWNNVHLALERMLRDVPLNWDEPPYKYRHWRSGEAEPIVRHYYH